MKFILNLKEWKFVETYSSNNLDDIIKLYYNINSTELLW
jgi:hypothetical protein